MNEDRDTVSVLQPLLDRVWALNESGATGQDSHFDARAARAILDDLSRLVSEIQTGHVTDTAEEPAQVTGRPTAGCDEMINLLDTVATATMISRSSLGTRAATRIRRGTPPGRIAEILQRRDRPAAEDRQPGLLPEATTPEATPAAPGGMPCSEALARVYEFLDDTLPSEDSERVRQHLDDCGSCLLEFDREEAVRRLVLKHCGCDPAPADLRAKVLVRIREIIRPDPLCASTPAELMTALRQLRAWAGNPTFRQMSHRSGSLPPSTIYQAMQGTDLPRLAVVTAIVTACGGTEQDQQRWATAWRKLAGSTPTLRQDHRPTGKALPHAVVSVPIHSLHPADSPRINGEDQAHVARLAEADTPLPPILVDRRTMRVIDGMHRLLAASLQGRETIDVIFFEGSEDDAFLRAVQENIAHGLPLQQADRRAAAERIIASHPGLSDRAIGHSVGLSAKTVAQIRKRSGEKVPQPGSWIGQEGKVRPLKNEIGRWRASEMGREGTDGPLSELGAG